MNVQLHNGTDSEQYRCAPLIRMRLDLESEFAHFPLSGLSRTLSEAEAGSLTSWTEFATLEGRLERLLAVAPYLNRQSTASMLESFHRAGFLIPKSALLTTSAESSHSTEGLEPIRWIGIPTSGNRVAALSRALTSYVKNVREFGGSARVFVANDSLEPSQSAATRALVRAVADELGVDIFYAGLEEKRSFAVEICRSKDLPPEMVESVLFGLPGGPKAAGANRNAMLLQTLGSMLLSVDDDTVCRTGVVPETDVLTELSFEGHDNPADVWLFNERTAALGFPCPQHVDLIGQHERLLGKGLKDAVLEASTKGAVDLDRMCTHILSSVLLNVGRVRSTYSGIAGDCGLYSDMPLMTHRGRLTRERLRQFVSERNQPGATREIVSQVLTATIAHGESASPGTICGLDNRTLLPPFLPNFQNQDALFATMLSRCADDAFVGYLPCTVEHDPEGPDRSFTYEDAKLRVSDIVAVCCSMWYPSISCKTVPDRLMSLGKHMGDFAQLPRDEFVEIVKLGLVSRIAQTIQIYDLSIAADSYQSDLLTREFERRIVELKSSVESGEYYVPIDYRASVQEVGPRAVQQVLGTFGQILTWWPTLAERVVTLRNQGIELGLL
jgi:hypothetical protein